MATKQIAWNTGSGNITLTYQGQGNGTIVVSSDTNNLSVQRSQTVVVKTTDDSIRRILTINQAAKPFTPIVTNYSYTGSVESVTLQPGSYKLECWGAQGGNGVSGKYGGKGGYSVGTLTLTESSAVYIYVGGKGNTANAMIRAGGFNGGGASYDPGQTNYGNGSGGGASDIRIGTDSLYARVIVAGGGGGAGSASKGVGFDGAYGGGVDGGTPTSYENGFGRGGTQSSYGTPGGGTTGVQSAGFGYGGGNSSSDTTNRIAGGGGGWYGGAGARRGPAGGGSGYVYTSSTASNYPSGCLLDSNYYLSDAETIDGDHSFPAPAGGTETGHADNGYARITRIS